MIVPLSKTLHMHLTRDLVTLYRKDGQRFCLNKSEIEFFSVVQRMDKDRNKKGFTLLQTTYTFDSKRCLHKCGCHSLYSFMYCNDISLQLTPKEWHRFMSTIE